MDWTTFGVTAAGVIFTAGGLVTWIKVSISNLDKRHEKDMEQIESRIEVMEARLNTHEEHFSRHDVVFENIMVNQKYMIQGL